MDPDPGFHPPTPPACLILSRAGQAASSMALKRIPPLINRYHLENKSQALLLYVQFGAREFSF